MSGTTVSQTGAQSTTGESGEACRLCELPTPDPPITDPDLDGQFCCEGCLMVSKTLDRGDKANATETGTLATPSDQGREDSIDGDPVYVEIEGMHCTTCERFLESRAVSVAGVRAADANYTAGCLRLVVDADTVDRDAIVSHLSVAGYSVRSWSAPELDATTDASPVAADGDDARQSQPSFNTPPTPRTDDGRLLVGVGLGMMVMLWYVLFLYPDYLGFGPLGGTISLTGTAGWYLLANVWVLSTVVLVYTGGPLLRGATVSIRTGQPNMDLLIGLAAGTAYTYSTVALLLGRTEVYFDITIAVLVAVTLGSRYEQRLLASARDRIANLTASRVSTARRESEDGFERVPVERIGGGDRLLVRAGERIPLDGTVVAGSASVDVAVVTGEEDPIPVGAGDDVVAGAIVQDGALTVSVGDDPESTLDRLVDLLWEVQATKSGVAQFTDRLAAVFVPLVIVIALGTTGWLLLSTGRVEPAVLTGLTVLVVSCPCALGLATPLSVARGVTEALDRGMIVRNGSVFEQARNPATVVFDKTGTLTTGNARILNMAGDPRSLSIAAAVERRSSHPIAEAIVDAADGDDDIAVSSFDHRPGRGVSATATVPDRGQETVLVGSASLFADREWEIPPFLNAVASDAKEDGETDVFVGWDGTARATLTVTDERRTGWETVLDTLADSQIVILSGDEGPAVDRFSEHPAVDETFGGVPPEGKAAVVKRLREEGPTVVVADGTNDAPALAAADLGIALAAGTDIAVDAADVVLLNEDLTALSDLIELTQSTRSRVRQNVGWALGYNAIAIPAALTGLLNPVIAAIAMATSSLLVVGNSARPLLDQD